MAKSDGSHSTLNDSHLSMQPNQASSNSDCSFSNAANAAPCGRKAPLLAVKGFILPVLIQKVQYADMPKHGWSF